MVSRRKRARLRYLRKWYDQYMHMVAQKDDDATYPLHDLLPRYLSDDPALSEIECDELQHDLIEARIAEIQATICVKVRFCSECQHMLDHWPASDVHGLSQPYSIRQYDTLSMEAGASSGCDFCTCMWQSLRDSEVLELYRKIEWRLHTLQARDLSSLAVAGWHDVDIPTLKMTLPGLDHPRQYVNAVRVDIQGRVSVTKPDLSV